MGGGRDKSTSRSRSRGARNMHDRSDMRNIDATSVVSVLNFNPDEWNNIPIPLVDCIKAVLHELKISSNSSQSQNMIW